jgi:hypothetical protein
MRVQVEDYYLKLSSDSRNRVTPYVRFVLAQRIFIEWLNGWTAELRSINSVHFAAMSRLMEVG